MFCPVSFGSIDYGSVIRVDDWRCGVEDFVFKEAHNSIYIDLSKSIDLGEGGDAFNYFITSAKRCYNQSDNRNDVKKHLVHYMNYFVKFYDSDNELLAIYSKIKYIIDFHGQEYDELAFLSDVRQYILSPSILHKVDCMNNDNYSLKLNYKNNKNPALEYNERHAMILMKCSLLMNIIIPIMSHFMHAKSITQPNDFIMIIYDMIFKLFPDVDIVNKLYETVEDLVMRSVKSDNVLWEMQPIRDINPTTHILNSLQIIIINVMPKYTYDQNMISLNYSAIGNCNKFQIQNAYYGYSLVSLSSSKRDENGSSEFDKFEVYLVKQDFVYN